MNNLRSVFEGVMFTNKDQVIERLQEEAVSLSSARLSDQPLQCTFFDTEVQNYYIYCVVVFLSNEALNYLSMHPHSKPMLDANV